MDMTMNYIAPVIAAGSLAKDPDPEKGRVSYHTKGKKKSKSDKEEKFAVIYETGEHELFSPVTYGRPARH